MAGLGGGCCSLGVSSFLFSGASLRCGKRASYFW